MQAKKIRFVANTNFQKLQRWGSQQWPIIRIQMELQQHTSKEKENLMITCQITAIEEATFQKKTFLEKSTCITDAIDRCVQLCKMALKQKQSVRIHQLEAILQQENQAELQEVKLVFYPSDLISGSLEIIRALACTNIAVHIFSQFDTTNKFICAGVRCFSRSYSQFFAFYCFDAFQEFIKNYCSHIKQAFIFCSKAAERFIKNAGFQGKIHNVFDLQPYSRGTPCLNQLLEYYFNLHIQTKEIKNKLRADVLRTAQNAWKTNTAWTHHVSWQLFQTTYAISLLAVHFQDKYGKTFAKTAVFQTKAETPSSHSITLQKKIYSDKVDILPKKQEENREVDICVTSNAKQEEKKNEKQPVYFLHPINFFQEQSFLQTENKELYELKKHNDGRLCCDWKKKVSSKPKGTYLILVCHDHDRRYELWFLMLNSLVCVNSI